MILQNILFLWFLFVLLYDGPALEKIENGFFLFNAWREIDTSWRPSINKTFIHLSWNYHILENLFLADLAKHYRKT